MGYVDKMTFKNARAAIFEARQGGQCFLVGFRKAFLGLPKGCRLRTAGPGP